MNDQPEGAAKTNRLRTSSYISLCLLGILAAGVVWLLRGGLVTLIVNERSIPAAEPQLVPRLAAPGGLAEPRTIRPETMLNWAAEPAPFAVVDNRRDALPNGLSIRMAPFMVNWQESAAAEDTNNDSYLIHHVNIGGDPMKGTTYLATVRVPKGGVESAEFVLMRRRKDGEDELTGHGALRFIFKKDRRPRVVLPEGVNLPGDQLIDDLIISWEAWRPPGAPYKFQAGLDPSAYSITARCLTGTYSFLVSTLRGDAWECFPLNLPKTPAGERSAAEELFYVSLLAGDSVARRVIHEMLIEGDVTEPNPSFFADWTPEEIERARALFLGEETPNDSIVALVGEADLSYHLLLRSCLTISMLSIDLTAERIYDKYKLGERERLEIAPKSIPGWTNDLVDGGRLTMLSNMPSVLLWVAHNQTVVPAKAFEILDEGGLLQQNANGDPIRYYYTPEGDTPYGRISENL